MVVCSEKIFDNLLLWQRVRGLVDAERSHIHIVHDNTLGRYIDEYSLAKAFRLLFSMDPHNLGFPRIAHREAEITRLQLT